MSKKNMKSPLIALLLIVALGGGYFWGRSGDHDDHGHETATETTAGEKVQYTCGMHPFIIQDEPGICPICAMDLTPLKPGTGGDSQAASGPAKIIHWASPMDPTYVRDEPGQDYMGHDLVPVYEDGAGGSAISIDPVTTQSMGVRTATVSRGDLHREVRTVGRISYDESSQYAVNSKIGGWIERLYVNQTGQLVQKGQPLLEIYSPELVAAQQEYLLALRHQADLAQSPIADIGAGGERLLSAARQRLSYWDISTRQIEQLEKSGEIRKTLTLYAPVSGIVSDKKAVEGMSLKPGMELMQLTDLSRIWVLADLYEYQIPWVKEGQTATVEVPHADNRLLDGTIAYIYPTVDPMSRTVQVRIELPNPGLALKPEMFVNVRLHTQSSKDVLLIPVDAILTSGTRQHVFVALGEGRFEPRVVETGIQGEDGQVQILSGLKQGEQVVTSAQFMLDSESKLREAIQKMMAPKAPASPAADQAGQPEDDLEDLF